MNHDGKSHLARPLRLRSSLRSRRALVSLSSLGLFGAVSLTLSSSAEAQSVVNVKEPNVLLLLDTSGSMAWAYDGTSLNNQSCASAGKNTRWSALAEVLTGKINNLTCGRVRQGSDSSNRTERWVPVASNQCAPNVYDHPQILDALAANPGAWPNRGGPGTKDHHKQPIVFMKNYGCNGDLCPIPNADSDICEFKSGEWDQIDDGLIDSFAGQIRFGMMTFDTIQRYGASAGCAALEIHDSNNWVHEAGPYGTGYAQPFGPRFPAWRSNRWGKASSSGFQLWRQHHLGSYYVWGSGAYGVRSGLSPSYDDDPYVWHTFNDQWFPLEFSYWYQSSSANWTTGSRDYSSESIGPLQCIYATGCSNNGQCVAANPLNCADGSCRCSGGNCVRTMTAPDTGDIGGRNSEAPPWMGRLIGFDPDLAENSNQRRAHNEMVQLGVLAAGPYAGSTPLAALMRDAKEFMLEDDTSRGAYLPDGPLVKLSPSQDTSFTDSPRCRQSHVVLITDGEPTSDLTVRPSVYAAQMWAERVKTYVIGVGLSRAIYDADGNGSLANDTLVNCGDLRDVDLGPGKMCETSGGLWKYADVTPGPLSSSQRTALRACCTLLDTAVAGGSERAYFPESQSDLKSEFNTLLSNIAGGTISRTVPVFAPAMATAIANNGSSNAPSVFFELRSSMDVPTSGGLWQGHLERVRYMCDATTDLPTRQPIDASKGDVFEKNLEDGTLFPKKLFTVVTSDPKDMAKSLRPTNADVWCPACDPDPSAEDSLSSFSYSRLGGSLTQDTPQTLDNFPTAIDSIVNVEDLLDIKGGDRPGCDKQLDDDAGANIDEETCARRAIKWWSGHQDPCEGATSPCRTRPRFSPDGSQLGAIYRSNPIIVAPPAPDSADQTYSNERADGVSDNFVGEHGLRPTMLYAQSIDGQLHAFTMSKNLFTGASRYNTDVPKGDDGKNNELWAFAPPIVMPTLWSSFNTHSRLLDGPLTAANVVYRRTFGDLAVGASRWSTVVVGSGGVSALGAYYYAVDVTDPTRPRFLWQLTRSDNKRLFGDYAGGAAITHLVLDRDGSSTPEVVAVAVLPGGAPKSVPDKHMDRETDVAAMWNGVGYEPRRKIRKWDKDEESRSLTFVELATGRVLARLHGRNGDTETGGGDGIKPSLVHDAPFDSPISGIPAPFPAAAGEPARQIYVGDFDGTMWRVDVSNSNPANWEAEIAWDAYSRSGSEHAFKNAWVGNGAATYDKRLGTVMSTPNDNDAADIGQPIQTAPVISLNEQGSPVILFSTGDQESFTTASPGMVNFVVAFTDEPNLTGTGTSRWSPRIDDGGLPAPGQPSRGVNVAFLDGARATGPLSLYDGQLIFSFFDPNVGGTCTAGSGGACAMAYDRREDQTSQRPIPFIDLDDSAGAPTTSDICVTYANQFVFGIAVNQVPSCGVSEANFNDPWLAGGYTSQTTSNSPGYQLVMHTGEGGAPEDPGGVTNSRRIALPTPQIASRISSWVTALE